MFWWKNAFFKHRNIHKVKKKVKKKKIVQIFNFLKLINFCKNVKKKVKKKKNVF